MPPTVWISALIGAALGLVLYGLWRRRAAREDDLAAARARIEQLEARRAGILARVPERDRAAAMEDPASVQGLAAPLLADLADVEGRLNGARSWLARLEGHR